MYNLFLFHEVDNTSGSSLLDLDMKVSTVFVLCAVWFVVMFFVGYNKYSFRDGRIRRKAGYEDDSITGNCAGIYTICMSFFSLRPMWRLMAKTFTDSMGWSLVILMLFWVCYGILAYGVGLFGTMLKHAKVAKQKRIYNIKEMLNRLDVRY